MKIIDKFEGNYHFLSNFYNAPITYENITYKNNEAAFQAQKELSRSIEFEHLPPNKAKSLGRRVNLRKDWNEIKIQVMYELVLAKFTQNTNLQDKLIETDNAKLIEGNWWNDTFWGVCNGKGRNELGTILEKVRSELDR